jgi:hypothetical protein
MVIELTTLDKLKALQIACTEAIQAVESGNDEQGERAWHMFRFAFKHILR